MVSSTNPLSSEVRDGWPQIKSLAEIIKEPPGLFAAGSEFVGFFQALFLEQLAEKRIFSCRLHPKRTSGVEKERNHPVGL